MFGSQEPWGTRSGSPRRKKRPGQDSNLRHWLLRRPIRFVHDVLSVCRSAVDPGARVSP
jgi:hypothetical protein